MFACLPWYDLAELRRATDALWRRVSDELRATGIAGVPDALNRRLHYEDQWSSGALLLGQACGYDVAIAYAHHLQLVSTPCYGLDGCDGPSYRSFVVVRADDPAATIEDLRGRRCLINTPTSHSGSNVLRSLVAPLSVDGRFFSSVTVSGAHETSLELLRAGDADVAAIDCVTFGLLRRVRPAALAGARVIHETVRVPAPPYVTSSSTPPQTVAALRRALATAVGDPAVAGPLMMTGVEQLSADDYAPIIELERQADAHGYLELRPL